MAPLQVLIVDDEEELVSALVERLDIRGVDAEGACDGNSALEILEERCFDVVLLDLKMPGLGGVECMKRIHAKNPDQKVILLTGHVDIESQERGRCAGAVDCLVKPVNIETLLEILNRTAGRCHE